MFEIQTVGPEFAARLVKLWIETFKQAYDDVHSAEDIAAYCEVNFTLEAASAELSSDETICCVGSRGFDPTGFYIVKHHNCPIPLDSKSSELKQIYVLAAEYGTGLGRSLYDHALKNVRSVRGNWVWLSVSDINYRAQAFYKKLGFERLGAGPIFEVGSERLPSSILACKL